MPVAGEEGKRGWTAIINYQEVNRVDKIFIILIMLNLI